MVLRRGFKSEAERIVQGVRADLGLARLEPLPLDPLADLLGVEVIAGDDLIPRARFADLDRIQADCFSACTFRPSPGQVVVVFNPLSASTRRKSDIAHELAHVLLNHDLSRIEKLGGITFLSCDSVQEEEATWLSGSLLLPREMLTAEVREGLDAEEIAHKHGVSVAMARYRLNATGVLRQNTARVKRMGAARKA